MDVSALMIAPARKVCTLNVVKNMTDEEKLVLIVNTPVSKDMGLKPVETHRRLSGTVTRSLPWGDSKPQVPILSAPTLWKI